MQPVHFASDTRKYSVRREFSMKNMRMEMFERGLSIEYLIWNSADFNVQLAAVCHVWEWGWGG